MQPGRRRHRVTFTDREKLGPTARGDYVALFSAWASFRAASGRDQVTAGQIVAFETAAITIPATPRAATLVVGMRAKIGTRDHRITSIGLPLDGQIEIAVTTDLKPGKSP